MRLYEYSVQNMRLLDSNDPKTNLVQVKLDFEPPVTIDVIGHTIEVTLRFPADAELSLANLRKMARKELPEVLRDAADISYKCLPEDGSELRSDEGLS